MFPYVQGNNTFYVKGKRVTLPVLKYKEIKIRYPLYLKLGEAIYTSCNFSQNVNSPKGSYLVGFLLLLLCFKGNNILMSSTVKISLKGLKEKVWTKLWTEEHVAWTTVSTEPCSALAVRISALPLKSSWKSIAPFWNDEVTMCKLSLEQWYIQMFIFQRSLITIEIFKIIKITF